MKDVVNGNEVIGYYRMCGTHKIAKSTGFLTFYVYGNGEWVYDKSNTFSDAVMGYDGGEPAGSPYGIGNSDGMESVEKISYEEFQKEFDEYYKK